MILLRRRYRLALLVLHVLIGAVLTLIFSHPHQTTPGTRFDAIVNWWQKRLAHILHLHITIHGHPINGSALWVANHISWIDIGVLGWPRGTDFLSNAEVRDWPLIGWMAARAGTLFICRRTRDSASQVLEPMVWHLKHGRRIILFPEGATSDGRTVRKFHPWLFATALLAQVPVQPVVERSRYAAG